MTLSSVFLTGAAFAMLFVAFVLGALMVIAAVAVSLVAVMATIFWVCNKMSSTN